MDMQLQLRQGQTLSPQMIQSMNILQMNTQELEQYLRQTAQENPALELEERSTPLPTRWEEGLSRRLDWLESNDGQNRGFHRQDAEGDMDPMARLTAHTHQQTLYDHLMDQLERRQEHSGWRAACCLAGCLNDDGYLPDSLDSIAGELGCSVRALEKGLELLQSLEPAGVGARRLGECLCLQLERQGGSDLARRLAWSHLDDLARCRWGVLTRELRAKQSDILAAAQELRRLEPRPGREFDCAAPAHYIIPDLVVETGEEGPQVRLTDEHLPRIHISSYYRALLRDTDREEVRAYLTDKVRQAEWLVRAIGQRRATLLSCAGEILRRQEDFFRGGDLVPMTMADVARALEVHESTVSRALRDKYLQCPRGTYPLSFFFSRRLAGTAGEGGVSVVAAKGMLLQLIRSEDPARPLSDQKLCDAMAGEGCVLNRRTVAKYRAEMNIPGASGRKGRT